MDLDRMRGECIRDRGAIDDRRGVAVAMGLALASCATRSPASFELDLGGLPSVVAVRIDDGAWTALAPYAIGPATTGYQIPFAATLDLMVACTSETRVSLHELRATRDELEATLLGWDRPRCAPDRLTSRLAGHVHTRAGASRLAVSAAHGEVSPAASGSERDFAFPVEAGELDFAVWDDNHLALRHDLDLRTPQTLPSIDLDREATLIAGRFGYDPLGPGLTMSGQVSIHTGRGLDIAWDTAAGNPRVVPYGVLAPGDVERVSIEGASRSTFQRFTGVLGAAFPDHVTFLPALTGIAVAGRTVTWQPFVDQFTAQQLFCRDGRDGSAATYDYDVTEAAGWVMAHGVGRIAIDLDAPGLPAFDQQIGDCTLEIERGFASDEVTTSGARSL